MQMNSSSASLSRLRTVYGLPTWRGLVLFCILGTALWFAITKSSAVDQWISILMFLLLFVHLLELNQPFSLIECSPLPFDPPFADEHIKIPILLSNRSEFPTEPLFIKVDGSTSWTETPPLLANSSRTVHLSYSPHQKGLSQFPRLRIKMRSASELFQLWKILQAEEKMSVLPRAFDHGISSSPTLLRGSESELSHPELIRDSRLFSKMDPKLFQKTGLPYLRQFEGTEPLKYISLRWEVLETLSAEQQEEQFSFWIKTAQNAQKRGLTQIQIDTPFFKHLSSESPVQWRGLKQNFSAWLEDFDGKN